MKHAVLKASGDVMPLYPQVDCARSCQCKKQYESMTEAVVSIDVRVKAGAVANRELIAYHCKYCDQFHVGHPVRVDESKPVRPRNR